MTKAAAEPSNLGQIVHRTPSFFRLWLKEPALIAAPAPSGAALARLMARTAMAGAGDGLVVELGGGLGAITGALIRAGVNPGNLLVFELNADLAAYLRLRFPDLLAISDDARRLKAEVQRVKTSDAPVSAVVSGLPLVTMGLRNQLSILRDSFTVMGERGRFVQFTYGPVVPVRRSVLRHLGLRARCVGWAVANFPPARVYLIDRQPLVS